MIPRDPWELELLDWSAPTLDGSRVLPAEVISLINAGTDAGARAAYWKLDGSVCGNGLVSRAALPVLQLLLATAPGWSERARPYCLELLGQIAASAPAPGAEGIDDSCLRELYRATWHFLHGLQFDAAAAVPFHVDLLSLLGGEFEDVREVARSYLQLALGRDLPPSTQELIRNTRDLLGRSTPSGA